MHFTPWPRWLRMVSTATVVLPVLRSPMMSSRCPRPIGVIASMALMPVCSGSLTGWRPMMLGACTSMRRVVSAATGPLPSSGSPRGLTTRPSRASPTGTDRMRPVALTICSSSRVSTAPRTTAPMESSSRLSASPSVPSSNSSSSLTAAPGSPDTRAMPSPTSTMRPTCSAVTAGVYSATWRRSASVISLASMVSSAICVHPFVSSVASAASPVPSLAGRAARRAEAGAFPLRRRHVLTEHLQAAPDTGLHVQVPDLDHDPGQQGGVHGDLELDRGAGQLGQRAGQALSLGLVDLGGSPYPGHSPPASPRRLLDEPVEDPDGVPRPPPDEHVVDEPQRRRPDLSGEQLVDDPEPGLHRYVAVGEHPAEGGRGVNRACEAEQLVLDLLELGRRHFLEQGGGETAHSLSRGLMAEHRFGHHLALCRLVRAQREPVDGRWDLRRSYRADGEGGCPPGDVRHPAGQQLGEHCPAWAGGDGGVAERRPQRGVVGEEAIDSRQVGGQRLHVDPRIIEDRRHVALERRVHGC